MIARLILHNLFLVNSKSVTLTCDLDFDMTWVCVCVCVCGGVGGLGGEWGACACATIFKSVIFYWKWTCPKT